MVILQPSQSRLKLLIDYHDGFTLIGKTPNQGNPVILVIMVKTFHHG